MLLNAVAAMVSGNLKSGDNFGLLGLQLNVTVHGGIPELLDSVREERKLGCRAMAFSIKWSDLEPTPGHIDLAKFKSEFGWREQYGFLSFVTLQTIDTNRRTLPADLMTEPWDSEKMLSRERALLDAMSSAMPNSTRAFMMGNEVDGYLDGRQGEVDPYLKFLDAGRNILHLKRPGLPVGVTTMYMSLASNKALVSKLQTGMDLVSMTYYPLHGDMHVRPPAEVDKDFQAMLAVAGKRQLFVQEAGVPAAPLLDSSEDVQSEFVERLFDAMEKCRSRLAGVCYFISIDFNDKLVDDLVKYYGVGAASFRAYLSTLGLKKQDGAPRKAWFTFLRRAKSYLSH